MQTNNLTDYSIIESMEAIHHTDIMDSCAARVLLPKEPSDLTYPK